MFNYVMDEEDIINIDIVRYIYIYTLVSLQKIESGFFNKSEQIAGILNNEILIEKWCELYFIIHNTIIIIININNIIN